MIFVHQKNVNETVLGFANKMTMSATFVGTVNISTYAEHQSEGDIEHITLGLNVEQLLELSSVCDEAALALAKYEQETPSEVLSDS